METNVGLQEIEIGKRMRKFRDEANGITYIENMTDAVREKLESAFCDAVEEVCGFEFDRTYELDEEMFQLENFIYSMTKNIGSGAWVKVQTDIGYNVYWAEPIAPKKDYYSIQREIGKLSLNQSITTAEQAAVKAQKLNRFLNQLDLLLLSQQIGIVPYYVRIRVAKNKYKYLLPTQYEISSGSELYQNVILAHGKNYGVTYKEVFKSNDKDIIHYIMSRGITKDEAIIMAKLKDIYFVCDVNLMMNKVFQPN